MKYVMINYSIPIMFTEAHAHKYFEVFGKITSAGFFKIFKNDKDEMDVETYGFSISMRMFPDEADKDLLKKHLFDIDEKKEMSDINMAKLLDALAKKDEEFELI